MEKPLTPIVRIPAPSPREVDRCIAADQPCVFTGVMDGQVAARRWSLADLRQRLAGRTVNVVEQDHPRVFWDPKNGLPIRKVEFSRFVRETFDQPRPGYRYLQDDVNSFPEIKQDYRLPEMFDRPSIFRAKFWVSGPGLVTPLHYDPVETLHWMIGGEKRFVFYRPGVGRFYPFPARSTAPFISRVDPDHPDPTKFPKFQGARCVELVLSAGEVLYLPAYWWHQVYSVGAVNVSLNFVWRASAFRSLRRLGQYLRARRHLLRAAARARAQEEAAARAASERRAAAG